MQWLWEAWFALIRDVPHVKYQSINQSIKRHIAIQSSLLSQTCAVIYMHIYIASIHDIHLYYLVLRLHICLYR